MHVKKILKIITDILMFVDFIFLMSHEVVRNLSAHGIFAFTLTFLRKNLAVCVAARIVGEAEGFCVAMKPRKAWFLVVC